MTNKYYSRPGKDAYFLALAHGVAVRGTCRRRKVGAIAVSLRGHILATGYNGTPRDFPHCLVEPCPGAEAPSGTKLDACFAVHAEENVCLQTPDVEEIHTLYVTCSPCIRCIKLLLNTGCRRVVFAEEYPHPTAKDLWLRARRDWVCYTSTREETPAH